MKRLSCTAACLFHADAIAPPRGHSVGETARGCGPRRTTQTPSSVNFADFRSVSQIPCRHCPRLAAFLIVTCAFFHSFTLHGYNASAKTDQLSACASKPLFSRDTTCFPPRSYLPAILDFRSLHSCTKSNSDVQSVICHSIQPESAFFTQKRSLPPGQAPLLI